MTYTKYSIFWCISIFNTPRARATRPSGSCSSGSHHPPGVAESRTCARPGGFPGDETGGKGGKCGEIHHF